MILKYDIPLFISHLSIQNTLDTLRNECDLEVILKTPSSPFKSKGTLEITLNTDMSTSVDIESPDDILHLGVLIGSSLNTPVLPNP